MNVVIGVIIAMAGIIWALIAFRKEAGSIRHASIAHHWQRRIQWSRFAGKKSIDSLREPMNVAALLVLGVAECEGGISADRKRRILEIFAHEFRLNDAQAADLLMGGSRLLRKEHHLDNRLDKILENSQKSFSVAQVESLLSVMHRVGTLETALSEAQCKLIAATGSYFGRDTPCRG